MHAMYLEYDVAEYFNRVKPLAGTDVLDWGCNHANFLQYLTLPKTYMGIDTDQDVLTSNMEFWPEHRWRTYDAYNHQYRADPSLITPVWPLLDDDRFDAILAFSVFTHTDLAEFRLMCKRWKPHLAKGGDILATFIANDDYATFCRILSHRPEFFDETDKDLFKIISSHPYTILAVEQDTGQKHVFTGIDEMPRFDKPTYFLSFYDGEWLADQLGGTVERPDLEFDSGIRSTQQCLRLSTPA